MEERSDGVLRNAVAERPVLFLHFHQIDENIFHAHGQLRVEVFDDGFVEQLFLLQGSAFAQGDLDDHQVVGAPDTQVLGVEDERLFVVFGEDLGIIALAQGYVLLEISPIGTTVPHLSLCFCSLILQNRAPVSARALPVGYSDASGPGGK
jgi:hypothetical protein